MKILISGNQMSDFTGQPMSTYETARVLSKDHDVTVVCGQGGWNGNELEQNLKQLGVKCQYTWDPEYDLVIASEFCPDVKGYKIQTVRGITEWESPIPGMDFYSCIRPDVQEHIITEHGIPAEKTKVIYNGVDRDRFKPRQKTPRYYTRIVAPCTVDKLRRNWLEYLVSISTHQRQLVIYAPRVDYQLPKNPFVTIEKPRFNMEHIIADADVVVGIYLGRVNLEAYACGVPSIMYDPFTLDAVGFSPTPAEFEERHNINNVVKNILKIYENRN